MMTDDRFPIAKKILPFRQLVHLARIPDSMSRSFAQVTTSLVVLLLRTTRTRLYALKTLASRSSYFVLHQRAHQILLFLFLDQIFTSFVSLPRRAVLMTDEYS